MAINIKINKRPVSPTFNVGDIVAKAIASGGNSPYTYTLHSGGDSFNINPTTGEISSKIDLNLTTITSFTVKATDSNSVDFIISEISYPPIQSEIHSNFIKPYTTYKITKDMTISGGVLYLPDGCSLDFQGGRFVNGTIILNNTKVLPLGCNIKDYVTTTIDGSYKEGQILYDSVLKKMKLWNGTAWVNMDGTPLT